MMKLSAVSVAVALFALTGAAQAVTFTYTGTTTGKPTFNRPVAGTPPTSLSGTGTAVAYDALAFSVTVSGLYTFLSTATASWDNYTFLYSSFNPASPLTGALIGNDDNPSIGLSGFTYTLTAGTSYTFVTTGFGNTNFGAFTDTFTGPGAVITAVPEPESYALLAMGLGVVGMLARRRRSDTL